MRWPGKAARQLLNEEDGFTLAELLVTTMIITTVMFALYSVFDMSLRVFSFGNDKTEAVANARLGLERMEREIRTAYPYNKTDGDATNDNILYGFSPSSTVSPNPSSSITFFNDDGDHLAEPSEQIDYRVSGGSSPALLRNGEPLVEFVQPGGLSFTYCRSVDSCGPSSPPSISEKEVKLVRIELRTKVDRGLSGTVTQTLTTDVTLRNRMR